MLLLIALLATMPLVGGCHRRAPSAALAPPHDLGPAEGAPEFIDESFEFLYPIFLRRKIASGPKAALWNARYHRRWVRWTGRIRSFTDNGITLRELPVTTTFDLSLWLNSADRAAARARYSVGDVITYIGRLDSYDDVWRTMYLVNGSILGRAAAQDAGF